VIVSDTPFGRALRVTPDALRLSGVI